MVQTKAGALTDTDEGGIDLAFVPPDLSIIQDDPEPYLKSAMKSVIKDYWNLPPYFDEPRFFHICTRLQTQDTLPLAKEDYDPDDIAAGCSIDRKRAVWKALGESMERFCLTLSDASDVRYAQREKLPGRVLDISSLRRDAAHLDSAARLGWRRGFDLPKQDPIWIPAQLVYVPYLFRDDEPALRDPISTGAAAARSASGAIYAGLCEVIERDAFMVSWLKQLRPHRLTIVPEWDLAGKPLLAKTIERLERYLLHPAFYLLPSDLPVPTVMCVLQDESGLGPPVCFGTKTAATIAQAMLGAAEEAQQLRPWLRSLREAEAHRRQQRPASIRTMRERAVHAMAEESVARFLAWIKGAPCCPVLEASPAPPNLGDLIHAAQDAFASVYVVDLTCPNSADMGLFVVKVVAPGAQPLYFDESEPDLVTSRLANAEGRSNSVSGLPNGHLETWPHPFI